MQHLKVSCLLILAMFAFLRCSKEASSTFVNWDHYQGSPSSNQYSRLDQINRNNVSKLQIAWTYESGGAEAGGGSQIQCNPLIIDGVLYGTNPKLHLFAIDAATGAKQWTFDPVRNVNDTIAAGLSSGLGVNRGMAFWNDGKNRRIYYTVGSRIFAVNVEDGSPYRTFGDDGSVDLRTGLGERAASYFVTSNSPGIIFKNLFVVGSRVSESMAAAPGHIRAFDVNNGELVWTFKTIPEKGQLGYDTWPEGAHESMGGANGWSGMSLDHENEILFVPTGSAAYDFYGGDRHGDNLFANCLIAINPNNGERIWHFQTVRHDLWDRDLPAPPNLVTLTVEGRQVDAVAQITKAGYVFIFDRISGQPLFPMEELEAAPSDLKGELAATSQLIPTKPPRFSRGEFNEEDITNRTAEAHEYVKSIWKTLRKGDEFTPPSTEGTLLLPGFDGGGEWGGAATDDDGIMYINASEMPWIIKMIEYKEETDGFLATKGKNIYGAQCQLCHGDDLQGASIYTVPSLVDIAERMTDDEIQDHIEQGKGLMPSFAHLSDDNVDALVAFLTNSQERMAEGQRQSHLARQGWKHPYFMSGYVRFKDQDGYPALTPPWGTLNAIDLNQGTIKWKVTLGDRPEIDADAPTGTENYGGPIVTAGDLVIIAATLDEKIRAFDKSNGDLLWEHDLPAAGYATPATYMVDNKQYVVIACGGGKCGTKSGDAYVAFSL